MVSLRNSASFGGKRRTVKIGCDCLYAISPPEAGRSNEKGDLAICNTTRVWLPCVRLLRPSAARYPARLRTTCESNRNLDAADWFRSWRGALGNGKV